MSSHIKFWTLKIVAYGALVMTLAPQLQASTRVTLEDPFLEFDCHDSEFFPLRSWANNPHKAKQLTLELYEACEEDDYLKFKLIEKIALETMPEDQGFFISLLSDAFKYYDNAQILDFSHRLDSEDPNRDFFSRLVKGIFENHRLYSAFLNDEKGKKFKLILTAATEVEKKHPGFIAALLAARCDNDSLFSAFIRCHHLSYRDLTTTVHHLLDCAWRHDPAANNGVIESILIAKIPLDNRFNSWNSNASTEVISPLELLASSEFRSTTLSFLMRPVEINSDTGIIVTRLEVLAPLLSRKDRALLRALATEMDTRAPVTKPLPFAALFSALLPRTCVFSMWALDQASRLPTAQEILAIIGEE